MRRLYLSLSSPPDRPSIYHAMYTQLPSGIKIKEGFASTFKALTLNP